jgi:hypothetical protein
MKISLFKNNTDCKVVEVETMNQLSFQMLQGFGWSPGVFKNNYRNLENFLSMDVIALDFDKGMTLEEAALVFSGYQHVIGTSRSHQTSKPGKAGATEPPCDRFRVVLALSRAIKTDDEYKATFNALRALFPAADPQCSDASRFFFPCKKIVQGDNDGKCVDPVAPVPKAEKPKRELAEGQMGKLGRPTLEFLTIGKVTTEKGRHAQLFKACKDLQEQGFDEPAALELVLKCPLVDEPGMPIRDFERAIQSAFRKEPKYEPRGLDDIQLPQRNSGNASEPGEGEDAKNRGSLQSLELLDEALAHLANPEAVRGISTGWLEVDELLGGLRQSELGIVQAYPKSGKTVFLTNLMCNLTAQGHKVGFASLEMHPAKQVEPDLYSLLLKKDIRKEVSDADKNRIIQLLEQGRGLTYFKRDRRPTAEEICDWARRCYFDLGIRFFFFDHFHKFVPDESSVSSIARTITALTGLKYECPEMFGCLVVQPTKEQRGREGLAERVGRNSLRGGAVIFDECDWLINLHTKYSTQRMHETPWGDKRENIVAAYPNDIRELEFEAIRAKPFSENMGKKLYMKYDKGTTEMTPFKWIAPPPERIALPERDEDERFQRRGPSGWGDRLKNKRL